VPQTPREDESLPLSACARTDEACERFEAAWKASQRRLLLELCYRRLGSLPARD
jgi:hypothetical protein